MEREEKKLMQKSSPVQMAKVMGNQAAVQRMPVIQMKKIQITSDELNVLEGLFYGEDFTEDTNALITKLINDGHSDHTAEYEIIDPGDKDDETHGVNEGQYLSPSKLRSSLGAGPGGEAHHIIPSCIAAANKWDPDEFNKGWNGIMLPGSKKPGKEIRPMLGSPALPYHRKNNMFDHPAYTANVKKAIAGKSLSDIPTIASTIKGKIASMGKGNRIDDLT